MIYGSENDSRRFDFRPGVNIITGESKRGKTSVIWIVDWCLGASKSQIPGQIADYAEWYLLHLTIGEQDVVLGRPSLRSKHKKTQMYFHVGRRLSLPQPKDLEPNEHVDVVKKALSDLLGLAFPDIKTHEADSPLASRPSVRDLTSFVFQPQNIVANKDVLLYRLDDSVQRKRVARIVPVALGVVDPSYYATRTELDGVEREIRTLEQKMERRARQEIEARIKALDFVEALKRHGVDTPNFSASASHDMLLGYLDSHTKQVELSRSSVRLLPDDEEERRLLVVSTQLREELSGLTRDLRRIKDLQAARSLYEDALTSQKSRVAAVDFFSVPVDGHSSCPVCGSETESAAQVAARYKEVAESLSEELSVAQAVSPALEAKSVEIRERLSEIRRELTRVEAKVLELRQQNDKARSLDRISMERFLLVGRIAEFVSEHGRMAEDALLKQLDEARQRGRELQERIDEYQAPLKQSAALSRINQYLNDYAQGLDLEWPPRLYFDPNSLTVFQINGNTPIPLEGMGSGANWVSCHVACLLGLHRFFTEASFSPVPSMLFVDQPSQVYFPSEEEAQRRGKSTDTERVRQIYRTLFRAVNNAEGKLQIIVLDHADFEDWPEFQGAVIRRFRDGQGLI